MHVFFKESLLSTPLLNIGLTGARELERGRLRDSVGVVVAERLI
jgi:hypothetical protein